MSSSKSISKFYSAIDKACDQHENCCTSGCSYCCYQTIEAFPFEEKYISDYINNNISDAVLEQLKCQLIDWHKYFKANIRTDVMKINMDDLERFRIKSGDDKRPCPLLIDNLCAIYHARPIACRTHFVQGSNLQCKKDGLNEGCIESQDIKEAVIKFVVQKKETNITLLALISMRALNLETH